MNTICPVRKDHDCRRLASNLLREVRLRGMNVKRVRAAILFADSAHVAQWRKTGEAFITHPLLVAYLVAILGGCENDVIAALLHDTHEDSPQVTLSDLQLAWGAPVAQRVEALTKDFQYPPEVRMIDAHGRLLQSVAHLGPGVAVIKLADRAHNSATSKILPEKKLNKLRRENQHLFAPLAHMVGAHGLARFLVAEPHQWWDAAPTFVATICSLQGPILWPSELNPSNF